jgi:hypothetical protein
MQNPLENRCHAILFDKTQQDILNRGITKYFPASIPKDISKDPHQVLMYLINASFSSPQGERGYQLLMAPLLRRLAIHTLKNGDYEVIKNIQTQYAELSAIDNPDRQDRHDFKSFDEFLNSQSRNGTYAQSFEAIALSVALGVGFKYCTVDVNTSRAVMLSAIELHSAGEDSDTVLLYNSPNHHYFIREGDPESTYGDGNCLYNGFAQNLKLFALKNNPKPAVIDVGDSSGSSATKSNGFYTNSEAFLKQQEEMFKKYEKKKFNSKDNKIPVQVNGVLKELSMAEYIKMLEASNSPSVMGSSSYLRNFFTHPITEISAKTMLVTGVVSSYVSLAALFFPLISEVLAVSIPAMFLISLVTMCLGKLILNQFQEYQKQNHMSDNFQQIFM